MPKLSIITVNLNNAEGLKKTIDSVINQTYTNYEYIIIDVGSTDGSVDIIKKYQNKFSYWVSEPDKGIYNGMNKGIKKARGEYCFFLNSGDFIYNKKTLENIFIKNFHEDVLYFKIKTEKGIIEYPENLTFNFFFKGTISHQASIIKTKLLVDNNYYNEKLKITADWEMFCKAYISNKKFKKFDEILCHYNLTGISAVSSFLIKQEKKETLKILIPQFYNDYCQLYFYETSKLVQFIKKFQQSKLYKFFRKPMYFTD